MIIIWQGSKTFHIPISAEAPAFLLVHLLLRFLFKFK